MKVNFQQALKKILLLVFSIVISFLIMEGLVRLISPQQTSSVEFTYEPVLGDVPIPNQSGFVNTPRVNYYTYHNNSLGMRGSKEYLPEKTKPRILLLGDSFTYGQQVNDDQTYGSVLQRQSDAYEVVNAGNPGKGTDYQLTYFNYLGYTFHPDLVVLSFVKNNFERNYRQLYYGLDSRNLVKKTLSPSLDSRKEFLQHLPFYGWLMEHSQLANLLKHSFVSYLLRFTNNHNDLVLNDQDQLNLSTTTLDMTIKLTAALKESVNEHGAKFLLVYIPDWLDITDYRAGKGISLAEKTIHQIADENHIDFVSWTQPMAQSDYSLNGLYVGGNGHMAVAGNDIVGRALFDYIKKSESWFIK